MGIWTYGHMGIWTYGPRGHMGIWTYGPDHIWRYEHMETYEHVDICTYEMHIWTYGPEPRRFCTYGHMETAHMDIWSYAHMEPTFPYVVHMSICSYVHMSICPYVHMSICYPVHMLIWASIPTVPPMCCLHMDIWTYEARHIWTYGTWHIWAYETGTYGTHMDIWTYEDKCYWAKALYMLSPARVLRNKRKHVYQTAPPPLRHANWTRLAGVL